MSYPINSVKPIRTRLDKIITEADNTVWILSGAVETDTASYPDARARLHMHPPKTSIATPATNPEDVTFDGTYIWVMCSSNDTVYRLNADGTASGFSFSVGAQATAPTGIAFDGTYLWVANDTGIIYKYDTAGVYQSVSIDITNNDPEAICFDGSGTGWVLDDNGAFRDFDPVGGTEGSTQYSMSSIIGYSSLYYGAEFMDANTLWILTADEYVHEVNWVNKRYVGRVMRMNDIHDHRGLCRLAGNDYAMCDLNEDAIYLGSTFTGIGMGTYQTRDGVPLYQRIK